MEGLSPGSGMVGEVAGCRLLLLRLGDAYYAFRRECPPCGFPLGPESLRGTTLECPACRRRYDARRGGRCLEAGERPLVPVPVLRKRSGGVKVAIRESAT